MCIINYSTADIIFRELQKFEKNLNGLCALAVAVLVYNTNDRS